MKKAIESALKEEKDIDKEYEQTDASEDVKKPKKKISKERWSDIKDATGKWNNEHPKEELGPGKQNGAHGGDFSRALENEPDKADDNKE